jgi:hypothetical protein
MKIIGFSLKKISAEKINPPKGKLEIKSGLNIEDISKEEVTITEKESIKFDFIYTIDYSPEFAKIEIKGTAIVLDDKGESKEIIKEWKKKKFVHPIKLPLFNFIMDKCNLKALELESEIGLPFHLPFPKFTANPTPDKNPANYAG